MQTAEQVYQREVTALPLAEQVRLAYLILNHSAHTLAVWQDRGKVADVVDESDEWSDDDLREWSNSGRAAFVAAGGDDAGTG